MKGILQQFVVVVVQVGVLQVGVSLQRGGLRVLELVSDVHLSIMSHHLVHVGRGPSLIREFIVLLKLLLHHLLLQGLLVHQVLLVLSLSVLPALFFLLLLALRCGLCPGVLHFGLSFS